MKITLLFIGLLVLAGCTSNEYCTLEPATNTLDQVFVGQWNNSMEECPKTFDSIGNFVSNEVNNGWQRLGNSAEMLYEPVSIHGTPQRLGYVGDYISDQWNDGIRDTGNTLTVIGRWMCLCKDKE